VRKSYPLSILLHEETKFLESLIRFHGFEAQARKYWRRITIAQVIESSKNIVLDVVGEECLSDLAFHEITKRITSNVNSQSKAV
jgi:hypothetical protein